MFPPVPDTLVAPAIIGLVDSWPPADAAKRPGSGPHG